jgi:hypothetical protein
MSGKAMNNLLISYTDEHGGLDARTTGSLIADAMSSSQLTDRTTSLYMNA